MDAILYFDGRCTDNGKPNARAGFGWALQIDGEEVANGNGMVDLAAKATVNVAEYAGVTVGLRVVVRDYTDLAALEVRGDSKLVINQATYRWACNTPHLQAYRSAVTALVKRLEYRGCNVRFQWIPREQNERADALAKAAFDETE
jgi:probable phosphoglycerate mutase